MCYKYQCSGNRKNYKCRVVREISHCSVNREFEALVEEKGFFGEKECSGNGDGREMEIQPLSDAESNSLQGGILHIILARTYLAARVSCTNNWHTWAEYFDNHENDTMAYLVTYFFYVMWAMFFASLTVLLVRVFAPYACGSGIPEVLTRTYKLPRWGRRIAFGFLLSTQACQNVQELYGRLR
uniref:Uncharacterized protein n=1 Tax=Romanomermis culicivorax TaxID=13658 RepID=A0A915J486_ROMCU